MRTYLDNASTSFPKPPSVIEAITRFLTQTGCSAGRGGYRDAIAASQLVDQARISIARLLNATSSDRFAFTLNGTDALNQLIHGYVLPGDRVITTATEHNSVLRPLATLASQSHVQVEYIPCDSIGRVSTEEVQKTLQRMPARLLIINHVSNVTGTVQHLDELIPMAHAMGVPVLVDAAQSLGQIPLDLQALPIDMLAAPGHKGLLGPLGTGLLYVSQQIDELVRPTRQGGTGSQSLLESQPAVMPGKMEAGNLNLPGIAGLHAGIEFLLKRGVAAIAEHHRKLRKQLCSGLQSIDGIRVVGPTDENDVGGVLSLVVENLDPQEVATVLDASYAVQVRAGLHCAPRIHPLLNTLDVGGTVRLSIGVFTTSEDVQRAVDALRALVANPI